MMSSRTTPSLCQIVQEIAIINNQAVFQIECEEYSRACSSLALAMQTCKKLALIPAEARNEQSAIRTTSMSYVSSPKEMVSDQTGDADCPSLFIWKSPLQLQIPDNDLLRQQENIAHFAGIAGYVTVFNLALCHHLRALSAADCDAEERASSLKKAAAFYTYSEKLLATNHLGRDAVMHRIILLNNTCHVYHLLGDELSSRTYLERLMTCLWNRTHSHVGRDAGENIPVDGFFRSVMTLIGARSAAPAA